MKATSPILAIFAIASLSFACSENSQETVSVLDKPATPTIDCSKPENSDDPKCQIDCTKPENASDPKCQIDCSKPENSDDPKCQIDCTNSENASHPDCAIDCSKPENADKDACQIDCSKPENASDPKCQIDCTKPENASDPKCQQELPCVHYRDFGAVGDGRTNDMPAIVNAHAYANANGLPVCADAGDVYYISDIAQSALIQTDTDWTGAEFIIDDSNIGFDLCGVHVFIVSPSLPCYNLIVDGVPQIEGAYIPPLTRHAQNIGMTLPQESVVLLFDTNTLHFIRSGENAGPGEYQQEVLLVDAAGNVAPESPVMWDYIAVTTAIVCPVDPTTITIKGGTFTTIANHAESRDIYYDRGIRISRSNVVIDGITHKVTGEKDDHGAPYRGFITPQYVANIAIQNSVFTGHKPYIQAGTMTTRLGSYDLQPIHVINMTFDHCTQTNDIADEAFWGILGTNYCKNIVLKHCEFSRFDAHRGVAGVRIENSKLGHQGLLAIGEGDFVIHDSTVMGTSFLTLRDDFGSTWRGDVEIRNSRWEPVILGVHGITAMPFLFALNQGTHNYGYECYMPTTIDIDGLYVDDSAGFSVTILPNATPNNTSASFAYTYPYHITEKLRIRNYSSKSGKGYQWTSNEYMYRDMQLVEE